MDVLATVRDRVVGAAGAVNRRVIAPRRHTGPLPYVRCRPTTNPILPVADMVEATAFYRRLGFDVDAYDEGYAWVKHCGWEWLHLGRVDSVAGNRAGAYLHVGDADAWHRAMRTASKDEVDLAVPTDTPWGKREFSFDDPAGNHVRIGSDALRGRESS